MPRFRLFSFRHPHPSAQADDNLDGRTALLSMRQTSDPNALAPAPDRYELKSESIKNKPDSGACTTTAHKSTPSLKTCRNLLELIASPASPTDGFPTVDSICLTRLCDDHADEAPRRRGNFRQPDAIALLDGQLPEPSVSVRRPRKLLPKRNKPSKLQPVCNSGGHIKAFQSGSLSGIPSNRAHASRSRAMSFGRGVFTADPTTQPPSPGSLHRSHTTLRLHQDSASKLPTSHAHLTSPKVHGQHAFPAADSEFDGVAGSRALIVQACSPPSQGDDSEDYASMTPSTPSQATPGGHLNSQAPWSFNESHHSSSLLSSGRSSAECVGPPQYPSSEDASDFELSTEAFSPHQRDMLSIMARYGKSMSKPAVSPRLTDVGFEPRAVSIPTGALGGRVPEKCSRIDKNPIRTTVLSHRSIKRAFASSPDLKQLAKMRSARKRDEEPEERWESPLGIKSQDPRLERFEALLRASDASTGGTIKLSLSPNIDPSCPLPPSLPRLRLSHNFFRSSPTTENDSEILEPICPAPL